MIRLGRGATVASLHDAIAASDNDAIVVAVESDVAKLERHLILAAIAPLAIGLAPSRRLCAIDMDAGADPAALAALAAFLHHAEATTGQVVKLAGADQTTPKNDFMT